MIGLKGVLMLLLASSVLNSAHSQMNMTTTKPPKTVSQNSSTTNRPAPVSSGTTTTLQTTKIQSSAWSSAASVVQITTSKDNRSISINGTKAEDDSGRTASGLTRTESLIGFAVAGSVLLVVCGYFLISFSVRRYRRWQLNRLLLSIRGDDPEDNDQVSTDADREPLMHGRAEVGLTSRRNERRADSSSVSNSSGASGSPPRRRVAPFDTIGLRASSSNAHVNEADCDILITERGAQSASGLFGAPRAGPAVSDFAADADADDPILILGDEPGFGMQHRNESLI